MASQIRKVSTLVPANIAAGHGRATLKECLNRLSVARGSLLELETYLLLANRVGLLPENELDRLLELAEEAKHALTSLRRAIKKRMNPT